MVYCLGYDIISINLYSTTNSGYLRRGEAFRDSSNNSQKIYVYGYQGTVAANEDITYRIRYMRAK